MYWLLTGNEDNETCIFYQTYNKSIVIEYNNFSCYNIQSDNLLQKGSEIEKVIIYDIYIKDNLIKYINNEEEKTFIYETRKINSNDNNLLIFKNIYKKTDNYKLPRLLDTFYDNIYRNMKFKIYELSNNTLQIRNNNNNFILTTTIN
jgi:hypothetical protein